MSKKEESALLLTLAANIKRLRINQGLSQSSLAEKIHVDLRTLQRFEAGETNIPLLTLHRVKKFFACEWSDLLGK